MSSTNESNKEATKKKNRGLSDSHQAQIKILRALVGAGPEGRIFEINQICELSGVKDEKEVQRFLYILEGQKLVSPKPEGDFTSKNWYATREGMRAWKLINSAPVAQ